MALNPDGTYTPDDASVLTQLDKVLDKGGPLMTKARTSAAQVANRRGLLNSSMAVQAGEQAVINTALPIASQQAQQRHQTNLAGGQIASTEKVAGLERGSRETLTREALASEESRATAEIASKQALSQAAITSQEKISASRIQSADREKAMAAVAQFDKSYEEAFRTISANENLPAATREKYLTHLAAIRDQNFNLTEQMYNISLVWTSPAL